MEGVFLVQLREFINSNDNIYKIGKIKNMDNINRTYPNDCRVLLNMKCKNSKDCQKYLVNLFNDKFIKRTYYGSDFYEGDENNMIDEIYKYLYFCNITNEETIEVSEETIEVPEETIVVPEETIEVSEETIVVPEETIVVPEETIVVPAETITVPDETIVVPAETITVTNNKIIKKDKSRVCPNCNSKFKFPSLLKVHFTKSFHCLLTEEEIKKYFIKNNSKHKCIKCNKLLTDRQAYLRHIRETICGRSQTISKTDNKIDQKKMISNLIKTINPHLARDILRISLLE